MLAISASDWAHAPVFFAGFVVSIDAMPAIVGLHVLNQRIDLCNIQLLVLLLNELNWKIQTENNSLTELTLCVDDSKQCRDNETNRTHGGKESLKLKCRTHVQY